MRIVQFVHPGPEHGWDRIDPDGRRIKDWNSRDHARKFMTAAGESTTDAINSPTKGTLVFWGEWEPQSVVDPLEGEFPHSPRWLHTPYLELNGLTHAAILQNTDPLVFGDRFRYAVCRQYRGDYRTILSRLTEGDIILFGSRLSGNFVLDTLFVVSVWTDFYDHSPLPEWTSSLHKQVTIDRIRPIPQKGLRMYGGERWSATRPYSFVPCLRMTDVATTFPRPKIKPEGALRSMLGVHVPRAYRCSHHVDADTLHAAWGEVVRQVLDQGCALGTRLDEPDSLQKIGTKT